MPTTVPAIEIWKYRARMLSLGLGQLVLLLGVISRPVLSQDSSTYVVQPGDTLSRIAREYGVTVAQILADNPSISDPNLIHVGTTLTISSIPTSNPVPTPTSSPTPQPTPGTASRSSVNPFQTCDPLPTQQEREDCWWQWHQEQGTGSTSNPIPQPTPVAQVAPVPANRPTGGGDSDDGDDTDNDGFDTTANTDNDGFDTTNNTDNDGFDTTANTDNDGFDTTNNTDNDGFDTTANTDHDGFDTTGNLATATATDSDNFSS